MAKKKDNTLAIILVLGLGIGLIILISRWRNNIQIWGNAAAPALPPTPAPAPAMTYDNEETIEFPDGFDKDTLMPKKIVVHRKAVVRK